MTLRTSLLVTLAASTLGAASLEAWGPVVHQVVTREAIDTLPKELKSFYKDHRLELPTLGLGQTRVIDQVVEPDDDAPVGEKRIETGSVVALDVTEAGVVEQNERLVVLPPQLAQPLDRERLRRDDQRALGAAGAGQAIQDQARLDGLAEPHLVGQEPTDRVGRGRALRDVELMREQSDASPQERAKASGLADRRQLQEVAPQREPLEALDVASRESVERRFGHVERPQSCDRRPPARLAAGPCPGPRCRR